MRLSPETGKEDCHIIDYVDTVNRVAGVMSVPTLLGLDPMKLKLEGELIAGIPARMDLSQRGMHRKASQRPSQGSRKP